MRTSRPPSHKRTITRHSRSTSKTPLHPATLEWDARYETGNPKQKQKEQPPKPQTIQYCPELFSKEEIDSPITRQQWSEDHAETVIKDQDELRRQQDTLETPRGQTKQQDTTQTYKRMIEETPKIFMGQSSATHFAINAGNIPRNLTVAQTKTPTLIRNTKTPIPDTLITPSNVHNKENIRAQEVSENSNPSPLTERCSGPHSPVLSLLRSASAMGSPAKLSNRRHTGTPSKPVQRSQTPSRKTPSKKSPNVRAPTRKSPRFTTTVTPPSMNIAASIPLITPSMDTATVVPSATQQQIEDAAGIGTTGAPPQESPILARTSRSNTPKLSISQKDQGTLPREVHSQVQSAEPQLVAQSIQLVEAAPKSSDSPVSRAAVSNKSEGTSSLSEAEDDDIFDSSPNITSLRPSHVISGIAMKQGAPLESVPTAPNPISRAWDLANVTSSGSSRKRKSMDDPASDEQQLSPELKTDHPRVLHVEASSTPIRVATVNSQSKKASPVDKVLISGNPRFLTEENVTSSFIHVEGVMPGAPQRMFDMPSESHQSTAIRLLEEDMMFTPSTPKLSENRRPASYSTPDIDYERNTPRIHAGAGLLSSDRDKPPNPSIISPTKQNKSAIGKPCTLNLSDPSISIYPSEIPKGDLVTSGPSALRALETDKNKIPSHTQVLATVDPTDLQDLPPDTTPYAPSQASTQYSDLAYDCLPDTGAYLRSENSQGKMRNRSQHKIPPEADSHKNPLTSEPIGFKTGNGMKVAISKAALNKAAALTAQVMAEVDVVSKGSHLPIIQPSKAALDRAALISAEVATATESEALRIPVEASLAEFKTASSLSHTPGVTNKVNYSARSNPVMRTQLKSHMHTPIREKVAISVTGPGLSPGALTSTSFRHRGLRSVRSKLTKVP